jgi:glycosyltransferase involved in cell wall biosynthesis
MNKKKLLVIANYFYPEFASTGQLMTELCEFLINDFDITVIASIPSYTGKEEIDNYRGKRFHYETYKDIKIIRVNTPKVNKQNKLSRVNYILTYTFNAFLANFKAEKPDIIFTISQPPILGGVLGVLCKIFRGGKLVYNIQDFNPEQAEAINYNKIKILNIIARYIDNLSCRLSDAVIVVGRDMLNTLYNRCKRIDKNKAYVINNWIDENKVYPLDKNNSQVSEFVNENRLENKFVFMYSGNIGLYYDLENIIKVIGEFKGYDDIRFVFIGEGAQKQNLIDYCTANNIENVIFLPYQPKEKIIYSLNSADVHLVTNQKGIKGVSVPSKIYGVMAVGKPVLGILERGSEAQLLIENSGCGITVEPQRYDEIKKAIKWFYENRDKLGEMGINGRTYLENNLKMKDSLSKYKTVLSNL